MQRMHLQVFHRIVARYCETLSDFFPREEKGERLVIKSSALMVSDCFKLYQNYPAKCVIQEKAITKYKPED